MSKAGLNFVLLALICASAVGQNNFKVLHSFSGYPNDGAHPVSDVVFDKAGNLYGVTPGGGSGAGCGENGCGSVYQLTPDQDGSWSENVIYSFCQQFGQTCIDGAYPEGGLVLDAKGNLYGVTSAGGTGACATFGFGQCGVAFELSPPVEPGAAWVETVIYNFCSIVASGQCVDGQVPFGQLTFDPNGNLYGTTTGGGGGNSNTLGGGGTVFELVHDSAGWKEKVLYRFCEGGQNDICPGGDGPFAGVTFDNKGNLFGTTIDGGSKESTGDGTVYQLSLTSGRWKESVLITFPAPSVGYPRGLVTFDSEWNLYSTYELPYGGVFRLNRETRTEDVFKFNGTDGYEPIGGVYVDSAAGILYGTSSGSDLGPGNFFQISRNGKETILHSFCSWTSCGDGDIPWSMPVPDLSGNLYGTTEFGGTYGNGVVFEVTP